MDMNALLKAIFGEFLKEFKTNPGFRDRMTKLIEKQDIRPDKDSKRSHRRKPGPFDPMEVYHNHPELLKGRLEALEIDQLKDIIAEQGMDQRKLAMKWKSKDRLIEHIIALVTSRAQKGDAFRNM